MEREDAQRQIRARRNQALQALRKDQELYTKWEPLWEDQCRDAIEDPAQLKSFDE